MRYLAVRHANQVLTYLVEFELIDEAQSSLMKGVVMSDAVDEDAIGECRVRISFLTKWSDCNS